MESAAGAGALAKVVLSLTNDKLPASLNYAGPNPYIQFQATNLKVNDEASDWPRYSGHAVARRVRFGFGGTNAHLVVREVLDSTCTRHRRRRRRGCVRRERRSGVGRRR